MTRRERAAATTYPLIEGHRYGEAMITAIVFVKADVARIPEVAEAIAALEGVSEVYSVTGQIDLIAMIRVSKHEDIAAVVADALNKVEGVSVHRDTHRVPDVLQARPGVGVLAGPGLTPFSRAGGGHAVRVPR